MRSKTEPNQIITVEELLAKMRAGVRDIHEIRMRELVIPVRVLSIDEMNLIRKDAYMSTVAKQGDEVDKNVLIQRSTLKLASTIVKGGGPLLSDKLLSMLTVDEVNYLYEEYIRVTDSVNPSLEAISQEQFRQLVDALKKNIITSKDCSLPQLRTICTAFVDMIQRQDSRSSHPVN